MRGYVRNLGDGRVEILAAGAEVALDAFVGWLWQGPPLSRVEAVDRQDAVARVDQDPFEIR